MGLLDGQVCIVTGAAHGIGRAIAAAFAGAGARVACLDLSDCAETVAAIGPQAAGFACDVADEAATLAAVARIAAAWAPPTVLVNNAAPIEPAGDILALPLRDWNRVFAVCVTGSFLMSRAVLPGMIAAGSGSIVHVASQLARVAIPARPAYCAAKGALLQFARAMALDHAAAGVRVNTLSPGAVATARIAARHGSIAAARDAMAPLHPIGRVGEPEEIAAAALFLASAQSSFMTGADLVVDGGYTAR